MGMGDSVRGLSGLAARTRKDSANSGSRGGHARGATRAGARLRIRICAIAGHRDLYFSTMKDALAGIKEASCEFSQAGNRRALSSVVDEYMEDKVKHGSCTARSAHCQRAHLRKWFVDDLARDIDKLTSKRAAALYERLLSTPTGKTGLPPSAATQRYYLHLARMLFRWAIRKGYLRENPFAAVQPVGRPNRGKKQLRFDEAERFISVAFRMFDLGGDVMALATVTALLLGCRAGEVRHLRVRDLDCGGAKLWVAAGDSDYPGKTRNAARDPDVPEVLRPRLLRLASGRDPDALLFTLSRTGKPGSHQAFYSAVHRVCRAAEVPVVCPHSLRGLWATAGVRSGALSHAVAAALGHGSFAVTAKHYVQPGALDGARTERLVELLALETAKPTLEPEAPSTQEFLASLPYETLARLVALAEQTSGRNA